VSSRLLAAELAVEAVEGEFGKLACEFTATRKMVKTD
jgi:hypothetical protein